jgi:hypothetical protein
MAYRTSTRSPAALAALIGVCAAGSVLAAHRASRRGA